jgi:hypothetical protein
LWVGDEVRYWLGHKPHDTFLIALTEGEIAWDAAAGNLDWKRTTALPRTLERAFEAEPLWVDLRFARGQASI